MIYLANFIRNVARYFSDNRAKWIRAALIAVATVAVFLLIRAGVERWQRAKYEKRAAALEKQFRDADAKAKDAEARAAAAALAIEANQAELRELQSRAAAAETALQTARRSVAPLKEAYEEIRTTPMPAAPVSCADVCTELAGLGYPCK